MQDSTRKTFTDVVKKIGEIPGSRRFSVLFKRKAAFYSVEDKNTKTVEALFRSVQYKMPVTVICDEKNSLILEAFLVA